jgi:hypothetical protein
MQAWIPDLGWDDSWGIGNSFFGDERYASNIACSLASTSPVISGGTESISLAPLAARSMTLRG